MMNDGDPEQDKKDLPSKDASAPKGASGGKGEPPAGGNRSDADEPAQDADSSAGALAEQRPPADS
jgi:hypothetical protein